MEINKCLTGRISGAQPKLIIVDDLGGGTVLTPQEVRAEIARERREATKERQLDRKTKRQNKRSQCY